jgi:hypothetical protein
LSTRSVPFLFLLLLAGCASSGNGRPASLAPPQIRAELTNPLFFGSGNSAPANIEIEVFNPASVPIILRVAEVSSPGMMQYTIRRVSRPFNTTIPPGESRTVQLFTTAVTTVRRPTEPLQLRLTLDFRAGDAVWRELVIYR